MSEALGAEARPVRCGCGMWLELDAVMEHLRLMHPEDYGNGPEEWPDGGPVVIDKTGDMP